MNPLTSSPGWVRDESPVGILTFRVTPVDGILDTVSTHPCGVKTIRLLPKIAKQSSLDLLGRAVQDARGGVLHDDSICLRQFSPVSRGQGVIGEVSILPDLRQIPSAEYNARIQQSDIMPLSVLDEYWPIHQHTLVVSCIQPQTSSQSNLLCAYTRHNVYR